MVLPWTADGGLPVDCSLLVPRMRAGMRTVRYFKAKKFNWLGLSQQPTLSAKVRRAAGQLLPWSYEDFDWQLTSGACCACARHLHVLTPGG